MRFEESHLSDQELLLAVDGELLACDNERVQSHLATCWSCRTRKHEIEAAIDEFVQMHKRNLDVQIPPSDGPRALLKARIAQVAGAQRTSWLERLRGLSWRMAGVTLGAACLLGVFALFTLKFPAAPPAASAIPVSTPNPSLTPGATVLVSRGEVCRESNTNNKLVSVALQRRVFDEYGIRAAPVSAYEVDYLITPALGGADDIHNLWPQSKAATVWNARVKDALEDRLREMVCDGQLDLATAQRDMATNWIEAYKKYFHTDRPLTRFR
jgi:hypothetical protein